MYLEDHHLEPHGSGPQPAPALRGVLSNLKAAVPLPPSYFSNFQHHPQSVGYLVKSAAFSDGKDPDRKQLRRQMRAARRALTTQQQQQAASALARQLKRYPPLLRSQRIGLYLPNDGEIDPGPLMDVLWSRGKDCYLPVLHPIRHNRLWFVRYRPGSTLKKNMFGIKEPDPHLNPRVTPWSLDLVLLPLVAFDAQGGRLGMGGGFYDRTFAYQHTNTGLQRPRLIGLAHDLQRVDGLPIASWDIPLSAIVTEQRIYQAETLAE